MKTLQHVLGAIASFAIAFSIMQGSAQKVVHFAGVANEMGTCLFAFMLGIGFTIMAIPERKKKNG